MLEGVEERVMIVVTPAEVARRAAVSFVDIPPVPREDPAVETGDMNVYGQLKCLLGGWSDVVTVNIQHGDVIDNFDWLCIRVGTRVVGVEAVDVGHKEEVVRVDHSSRDGREGVVVAEFNFLVTVSYPDSSDLSGERKCTLTDKVSFSFTIGIIPMFRSSEKVFTAFRY